MISKSNLIKGLVQFAESEMLPALEGWQYWIAVGALVVIGEGGERFADKFIDNKMVKAFGLVSETGLIDIDKAYNAIKKGSRKHKLKPIALDMGAFGKYTLRAEDLDALYKQLSALPSESDPDGDDDVS